MPAAQGSHLGESLGRPATPGAANLSVRLVVRPGAPSSVLVTTSKALVTRSDALVPTSVLVPSKARSPERSVLARLGCATWSVD